MFALERIGVDARLSSDRKCVAEAERLILPGVGAAKHAMAQMAALGLVDVLATFSRPMLGVCLGQQLLYQESEEGDASGLGRIAGRVEKLTASAQTQLPHMGWSRIEIAREHPLLEGVVSGAYAYFAHSFVCPMGAEAIATARCGRTFPAMIASNNLYGCQFHPERSGALGQRILANFIRLPC
jgi:glutamine amidotransferase